MLSVRKTVSNVHPFLRIFPRFPVSLSGDVKKPNSECSLEDEI